MLPLPDLLLFSGAAVLMALTPGPNMLYLVSRAVAQGVRAGVTSWAGVVTGFAIHMVTAALGVSALILSMPFAYDVLRLAGAAYLLHLAWQTSRTGAAPVPGAASPAGSRRRLFTHGLLTSALNPKVAVFYVAVLPQFLRPELGKLVEQSFILGGIQLLIGASINLGATLAASKLSARLLRPGVALARVQRYLLPALLVGIAVWLLSARRS